MNGLSVVHECVCVTRGSRIVSNAAHVLGTSVVRGMKGVRGMYKMFKSLARGNVGGEGDEWIRGMGLALPTVWEYG